MFGHSQWNSKSLGAPKFMARDDLFDSFWGPSSRRQVDCHFLAKRLHRRACQQKPPEISSPMTKGITFRNWVEELHYQQHTEELEKKETCSSPNENNTYI